jgi:multiple sugar transport system permease protein
MRPSTLRAAVLLVVATAMLLVWVFPVAWGLLTSLKTERDVLAYPPMLLFEATVANYRDVFTGSASIVPNLVSSFIVSGLTTTLTMLFAIPAAYALARLNLPWKRGAGFWVLATQMLPPVGLVIPYFLLLRKVGWTDTYQGLVLVYLTFALPFAIWLLVSYFEEIPREMEEAALLDRAGRFGALWHVVLPQVKGGIAVTVIFVFLNSWNEFLFAVVLGGNTVRTVTVAMFNFISLEQTQWARLAAAAMAGMAPVIVLGLVAQKHIVKGLTVGAVKGGGRR